MGTTATTSDLPTLMRSRHDRAAVALRDLLKRHGGNQSKAAREIGVTYLTITRWRRVLEEAGYKFPPVKQGRPRAA